MAQGAAPQLQLRQTLRDEWSNRNGSAGGCSNFVSWRKNPVYLLTVPARTPSDLFVFRVASPEMLVRSPDRHYPAARGSTHAGTPCVRIV